MDKHTAALARAEEAARLLNSDLFAQAFAETRAAILDTWSALPTTDSENARDLHRMLKCLDRVRRVLEQHIATGKLVAREIDGRTRLQQAVDRYRAGL